MNAADTTHTLVQLGTLFATAVAFFMAVAVPDAFGESAWFFAVAYVLERAIGLILYAWVASEDPSQRAAVRIFTTVSAGGLVAVLVGGQMEGWNLHPEHFGERHGLFVIIALGETLIVAAGGMTQALWTDNLIGLAVLVVAITCALWWSYFTRAKPALDHALSSADGAARSRMARDVYSLVHFPMLCGVIAFAAAVEEAIAHPGVPLALAGRSALAATLILFVGGMALALWRATGRLPLSRVLLSVGTAIAIVTVAGYPAPVSLAIAFIGIVAVATREQNAESYP